ERLSLDDGLQQLLSVCRPGPAVRRLYKAWCDEGCAVWCEGELVDPTLSQLALGVEVRADDDSHERLKFWAATDMVMINGRLQPRRFARRDHSDGARPVGLRMGGLRRRDSRVVERVAVQHRAAD